MTKKYPTKAEIRVALLRAAAMIETEPQRYSFMTCAVPRIRKCQDTGCALGWIAAFLGSRKRHVSYGFKVVEEAFGHYILDYRLRYEDMDFYNEMDALMDGRNWRDDPKLAAEGVRKFADAHFPGRQAS